MILIPCVHCGPRNVTEFRYCGEVGARPDPERATRAEWSAYLYSKTNAADWTRERWLHTAGCRRYFVVERHTVSNALRDARPPARGSETS
jgi:heterotetrameric sarcosine oxidase delta subunit